MRTLRTALYVLFATAGAGSIVLLARPHDLEAAHTAGHQARAQHARRIEAEPPEEESALPICKRGQVSTDREPCLGANGRLDY